VRRLVWQRTLWSAVAVGAALLISAAPALAAKPGNECKHGGYNSLVGTAGETFAKQGDCINYAESGGQFAKGVIIPRGGQQH